MTANAADAVWQKLDKDLKEYGDKVQLAKTQFDGLSGSITKFGKQLEEAQAREQNSRPMREIWTAADRPKNTDSRGKPALTL